MHLISPACYSYLQSLGCMCLPHPRNLLKLCSNIGLENEFSSYLETATINFNSLQRNVIIHMDEIHIKSDISFREEKLSVLHLIQMSLQKQFLQLWYLVCMENGQKLSDSCPALIPQQMNYNQ